MSDWSDSNNLLMMGYSFRYHSSLQSLTLFYFNKECNSSIISGSEAEREEMIEMNAFAYASSINEITFNK